jgi:hypothetical protein
MNIGVWKGVNIMSHYEIHYSKKDNGWVPKKQTKNYKYIRVANSPAFKTIEETESWVRENDTDRIGPWIDHVIEGSSGHLMALDDWKEDCDDGGFIDDDGHGNAVDENYKIIELGGNDFWDSVVSPSDWTVHGGKGIPENTKYILWYNR